MSRHNRSRLFVDGKVQGALVIRAAMYWAYCLLSVTLMLCCWQIITQRPSSSWQLYREIAHLYGPALLASLLVLPIVVFDVMRLSNRFAGPMVRLRRNMRDLADGKPVSPIHFREGDYWCDFANDFNRLLHQISCLQQQAELADESAETTQTDETPLGV